MTNYSYPAVFEPVFLNPLNHKHLGEQLVVVNFGLALNKAEDETRPELIKRAEEALAELIKHRLEQGDVLPEPTPFELVGKHIEAIDDPDAIMLKVEI